MLPMDSIASRLRETRELRGMTQAQLAQAAGVSQGTIGNIESGKRLGLPSLPAIADALRVSLRWLRTGVGAATYDADDTVVATGTVPARLQPLHGATLVNALPLVLDAMVKAPERAKLRAALLALLEDDSPAYRARITELLIP